MIICDDTNFNASEDERASSIYLKFPSITKSVKLPCSSKEQHSLVKCYNYYLHRYDGGDRSFCAFTYHTFISLFHFINCDSLLVFHFSVTAQELVGISLR